MGPDLSLNLDYRLNFQSCILIINRDSNWIFNKFWMMISYLPALCIGEDIPGFGSSPILSKVPKGNENFEFRRFTDS